MTTVPARESASLDHGPLGRATFLLLVSLAATILVLTIVRALFGSSGFEENGPVETASVVTYLLVSVALLVAPPSTGPLLSIRRLGLALLPLALAARELDAHKALFSGSMTRSAFYVDGTIPLWERATAALLVLAVIAAVLVFLRALARDRLRSAWSRYTAAGVFLLALAKGTDGLGRKLGDIGVSIGENAQILAAQFEETLELTGPCLFLIAALLAYRTKRRAH